MSLPSRSARRRVPGSRTAPGTLFLLVVPFVLGGCLSNGPEELDPEQQLDIYVTTATYLYEDGSLERAQDQAVKALGIDPEHKSMRRMVGWIRLRQGSPEDVIIADQFFETLLDDGDDNISTILGAATTKERLGVAYDEASRAFAAGERPAEDERTTEQSARHYAKKARDLWSESLVLYEDCLEDSEGATRAMNGLQRVHALVGNYEESLGWSAELIRRGEEELKTWRRLLTGAELTSEEEDLFRTNAEETLQILGETHLFTATLLYRLGRYDEGIDHLDAMAAVRPDMPQVYSLRAQLRSRIGQFAEAIEDIDRFLRLSDLPLEDPEVQRAFELRAYCESELGQG